MVTFEWTAEQDCALKKLKSCLTSQPIVRYPTFARNLIIHTDALGYGVGEDLGRIQEIDGKEVEVVIAYSSRHLHETQLR